MKVLVDILLIVGALDIIATLLFGILWMCGWLDVTMTVNKDED